MGKRLYLKLTAYGIDWFILALGGLIFFAFLFPSIGTTTKPVNITLISGYGVSVIFFFYGLKLSPSKFKQGISNWKMHILIQITTFVLFPVFLILLKPLFNSTQEYLWLSIFYLAALPSTVTSSVVMVSIAGGNIPSAIFNASISSLAGIFISPLWMGLYISSTGIDVETTDIVIKLVFRILIPIIAGSILHKQFGKYAEKYNRQLKLLDQSIILLIVYTSFCKSFADNVFAAMNAVSLSLIGIGAIALFFLSYFALGGISTLLSFSTEDKITVQFCGSKKSLLHGAAISKILFAGSSISGIILLPIMLYHPIQLLLVSIVAKKYSNRNVCIQSKSHECTNQGTSHNEQS